MMWRWDFFWSILPAILNGFVVTVHATLLSFAVALVIGLVFALARRSPRAALSRPARAVTDFVRGTPLLVQLYFLYYVLPLAGLKFPALTIGIFGLGLHYATYIAEIYRAGIDAVPRGQWEAAAALDLRPWYLWTRVILPQAIPPIIPALGNRLIALFKETPLLAAITVAEMLLVAREIGDEHFSYLEPYTAVGLFFLIASLVSSAGVTWLERKYGSVEAAI
ncbi:MAG: ectoine/hydroxyectoine ABC transporter permease subunit EhuD [Deltaproteobacteria bacterium]|nr:ectoine/hydroxyectoine ABC transporter permease subunit EhuD [Deltaproteobacteria bacterium]